MLMPLPVFRHCRHHVLDVNNFKRLPLFGVISPPRSISDERHDDESSKLEPRRRWRWKQAQLRSIIYSYRFTIASTDAESHIQFTIYTNFSLSVLCLCELIHWIWIHINSIVPIPIAFALFYLLSSCRQLKNRYKSHRVSILFLVFCFFCFLFHSNGFSVTPASAKIFRNETAWQILLRLLVQCFSSLPANSCYEFN